MKYFCHTKSAHYRALFVFILVMAVLGIAPQPIYAATITVNTVADNTTDDAFCTLHEAILAANDTPANANCGTGAAGLDTIAFNLGAGTPSIALSNPLPDITQPVIINGATGGATRVEILGDGLAAGNGLALVPGSSGSTIKALVLSGFANLGFAAIVIESANNRVENCLIGTDNTGLAAAVTGNWIGIMIQSVNATGNVIGGNTAAWSLAVSEVKKRKGES